MEKLKISLRNDYAFKRVFGDEKNKPALIDFLSTVLDIPTEEILDVEFLDKELTKDLAVLKTGVLDLKLRLKLHLKNMNIGIEIQNIWQSDFDKRALFYWAKMFTSNFYRGMNYTSLEKCVTINLVGKGFQLNNKAHSIYKIIETKEHKQLNDLLEIHFLDLARAKSIDLTKAKPTDKKLINWLKYIATDEKEERMELSKNSLVLEILNDTTEYLGDDPIERALYESRMMMLSDIITTRQAGFNEGVEQGIQQGIEQGIEKGIEQEKLEVAKNFKSLGIDVQKIAEATGLSLQEVESL